MGAIWFVLADVVSVFFSSTSVCYCLRSLYCWLTGSGKAALFVERSRSIFRPIDVHCDLRSPSSLFLGFACERVWSFKVTLVEVFSVCLFVVTLNELRESLFV